MSASADATTPYSPKAREIIQRTNELLAAGGYNGFSYADIAKSVGVRKASIHHHFPAKADLVRTTVALHRQALRDGLKSLQDTTPDPYARLVAYTRLWANCIEAASPPICICALLAAELPTIPAEVAEEVTGHFEDLQAWLTATIDEGVSRGLMQIAGSPEAEGAIFMAAVHGAMLSARAMGDPASFWPIVQSATERVKPTPA